MARSIAIEEDVVDMDAHVLDEQYGVVRDPVSNWAKIWVVIRFYDSAQYLSERLQHLPDYAFYALNAIAFDAFNNGIQATKVMGVYNLLHSYTVIKWLRHQCPLHYTFSMVLNYCRDALVFDAAKRTDFINKEALRLYLSTVLVLECDEESDEELKFFMSYSKLQLAFPGRRPPNRRQRRPRKRQLLISL